MAYDSRIVRVRIPLLLLLLSLPLAAADRPGVGDPAPPLSGPTLQRGTVDLADLRGRVVLLQFWASYCRTCTDNVPKLAELRATYGDDLEIVGVSLDAVPGEARKAVAEHGIEWPVLFDGKGTRSPWARAYGVRGTPRYVLIDREGNVADPMVKPSELERALRAELAERGEGE